MPGRIRTRWQALGRRGRLAAGATAVVLVVVAGLGAWLLTRGGGGSAATALTATVTSGTVQQTVSATGTVEPLHTADLDFGVSGTVTRVYVAAGSRVRKGQPLARVDDTQLVAASTAAQASLAAAEEQLTTDEDDGASAVQLAADRSAVVTAEASATSAEDAVRDAVLRSTISGTVSAVDVARGDTVSGGSGTSATGTGSGGASAANAADTSSSGSAFTVVSTRSYQVTATVAASDATQLQKGLEATITVTGDSQPVYGTVTSVGMVAQTSSAGAAVFPVTIKVTGHPTGLYAGSSATASIVVKEVKNVVQVSSRAIQTDSSGNAYVEKVVGGRAVKTPVRTGTVYGATTQILSGLKSGDVVRVPGFSLPSGLASRLGSGRSGFGGSGGFGGFGGRGLTSGLGSGGFTGGGFGTGEVNP